MTDLVSDLRLIRIYWLVSYYVDSQPVLYVEGPNEMGWQLGERTLWCYLGEGRSVHLSDSLLGVAVAPSREVLKRRIQAFLRPEQAISEETIKI
jgi:hypothetical protein